MKQQEVFKRIGIIIKELNQQYDYLSETEGKLNDLELELFVANAHFLADHSEVLNKLNLQNTPPPPAEKPKISYEEKYFEPLVQQVKPVTAEQKGETPIPSKPVEIEVTNAGEDSGPSHTMDLGGGDSDGDDFSYIRQEPEVIKHELILDESEDWDDDDEGFHSEELTAIEDEPSTKIPIAVQKEEPLTAKIPEPVTEQILEPIRTGADRPEPIIEHVSEPVKAEIKASGKTEPVADEKLTVNQRISAQLNAGARVSEQLNTQVITDLKQAINLNDKLLYVRDLFNGYSLAYSEVIDILNRFSNFEEADKFLQINYAVKNNWDSKQATVDKFYTLLRRRYL